MKIPYFYILAEPEKKKILSMLFFFIFPIDFKNFKSYIHYEFFLIFDSFCSIELVFYLKPIPPQKTCHKDKKLILR